MPGKLKTLVKNTRLYPYLRFSSLFNLYELVFKPGVKRKHASEVNFYKSFLTNGSLIFDIGAYDGHKTAAFLELADKVVSCEPDLKNYVLLKVKFRNQKKVFLENIAVAEINSTKEMFIHHPGSAFNTLNPKFKKILETQGIKRWKENIVFKKKKFIQACTLDTLIEKYGVPYYIKIDAEGNELQIIKGLSKRISFVSLEFILPEFYTELAECVIHMENSFGPGILYNIAVDDKLVWKEFKDKKFLINNISTNNFDYVELIIKMKTNH